MDATTRLGDMTVCRGVMICIFFFPGRFGEARLGHFFGYAGECCSS